MTDRQAFLSSLVEGYRKHMEEALDFLWKHPETGYTEWQSHAYLKEAWEKLGYELTFAGNIPGFYTDVDTGRPGPMICIMGELDALDIANHPCSVNGMNHSCGHCAQGAAMLGVVAAFADPKSLDGLSGKIRLMMVPAEELIQLPFREKLMKEGTIHFLGGKAEFIYRGYFDDVDLSIMIHTGNVANVTAFTCGTGNNGIVAKTFKFTGKSAHAGGSPQNGINAEYAAMLGLNACNALRETFPDADHVRFHPILHGVSTAVNIIPNEIELESYVRGRSFEVIKRENEKINRALAGAALSMGANLEMHDRAGYVPEFHYHPLMDLMEEVCVALVGKENVNFDYNRFGTGSSDFGDLTALMPGIQLHANGASGTGHGTDYYITDFDKAVMNSAKAQVLLADALLKDDAAKAKEFIRDYEPTFKSVQEYISYLDDMNKDYTAVTYNEDGTALVRFR